MIFLPKFFSQEISNGSVFGRPKTSLDIEKLRLKNDTEIHKNGKNRGMLSHGAIGKKSLMESIRGRHKN